MSKRALATRAVAQMSRSNGSRVQVSFAASTAMASKPAVLTFKERVMPSARTLPTLHGRTVAASCALVSRVHDEIEEGAQFRGDRQGRA